MGSIAHSRVEAWMDQIEALDAIYLGLCSADPFGVSDPLTVETEGGTYARVLSTWTRTAYNALTLNAGVVIRGLPPGATVAAVVGWSTEFTSSLEFADVLGLPISYPSGGTYVIPANEFVVGVDLS